MRKLPIGIQHFESLRRDGYVYVDKTALIHKLITEGKVYFLSRPRRFGKSLLVSTLAAVFEGKRDLFQGLAIDGLDWDWTASPVIRIDMNAERFRAGVGFLQAHLEASLATNATLHNVPLRGETLSARFSALIADVHRASGSRVVVLIDEYDKPLLETMHDASMHGEMKSVLKALFGVLKSSDEHLRFGLLTGVTKFGQVSVFSDLNQLRDISMEQGYATLCGITQEELERDFGPELTDLAQTEKASLPATLDKVRLWYNGYRFSYDAPGVYNPFSSLNLFAKLRFEGHWFATGTPTFLMELIEKSGMDVRRIERYEAEAAEFADYRADADRPIPVLYQSGYLTLVGYDPENRLYTLDYPNFEVREGFLHHLVNRWVERQVATSAEVFSANKFLRDLKAGNVEGFMTRLTSLLASIPYQMHEPREEYWQSLFYLAFRLMGQYATTEVHTSKGRCDAVVETAGAVYVFEFKYGGSEDEALAQIQEKGYAEPYRTHGKPIHLIGAAFDVTEKNVVAWKMQALSGSPGSSPAARPVRRSRKGKKKQK